MLDSSSACSAATLAIKWLGHATVQLEVDGVRVLTDPVLRDRVGPLVRIAPSLGPDAVGPVDCVLLSHLHYDHTDIPTLRSLARSGPIIAPYPARDWLIATGLPDVQELHPGDEIDVSGLRVAATPAIHDRRRRPFGPAADPVGYTIRGSYTTYFAGDTDLFPEMAELRGLVDVALVPVSGWGSRLGPGHLNPERAAAALALIAPAVAVPIHWGTYALRTRVGRGVASDRPALEFAAHAQQYAPSVEVRVLAPGGQTTITRFG
jgi:L-ascorbate metabolism protein UlaG (beta-lactamase superfamily)